MGYLEGVCHHQCRIDVSRRFTLSALRLPSDSAEVSAVTSGLLECRPSTKRLGSRSQQYDCGAVPGHFLAIGSRASPSGRTSGPQRCCFARPARGVSPVFLPAHQPLQPPAMVGSDVTVIQSAVWQRAVRSGSAAFLSAEQRQFRPQSAVSPRLAISGPPTSLPRPHTGNGVPLHCSAPNTGAQFIWLRQNDQLMSLFWRRREGPHYRLSVSGYVCMSVCACVCVYLKRRRGGISSVLGTCPLFRLRASRLVLSHPPLNSHR